MARMPLVDGDPQRIGRYRLTARLGVGGMGVVYLGTAKDGSQAAVKVVRPELAGDHEFRARFQREVQILSRVQGLCTVRVIEADTGSARPFLATEYADGPSLAEYVSANGPLGPGLLLGLAAGLAEALAAIHAAGVIHRDLKPGNVLLTPAGPKVIDFGIAQAMDATALTRTGTAVGSPGFMAPEQIMGRTGQPADVFSWGLTVAYAASGQPPFGTGPTDGILYRIIHDRPDTEAVPAALSSLVQAALAKNPDERPTAGELLRQLTGGTDATGTADHPLTEVVLSRSWLLPTATVAGHTVDAAKKSRRRRPPLLLAGAAGLAAVAGTGIGLMSASSGPTNAGPVVTRSVGTTATPRPISTTKTSPAATTTPTSSPITSTPTAVLAAPPLLIINAYSGTEPTELTIGMDNVVSDIVWSQWDASGALGTGTQSLWSCNPNCVTGAEPVTVSLGGAEGASPTSDGHFTTFSETDKEGHLVNAQYGHKVSSALLGASGGSQVNQ